MGKHDAFKKKKLDNLEARSIGAILIRIEIWNAKGILNKKIELEKCMSEQDECIIYIVSETQFINTS